MRKACTVILPTNLALGIEKNIVAAVEYFVCSFFHPKAYGGQVVNLALLEILRQHRAAITIYAHVLRLQAQLTQLIVTEAADTRLGHTDFNPVSALQY